MRRARDGALRDGQAAGLVGELPVDERGIGRVRQTVRERAQPLAAPGGSARG